jgi:hypothetical protein
MTLAARRRRDAAAFRGLVAHEPLPVVDATAITEPTNADEALAVHARYAEAGDTLTVHSAWCRLNLDVCEDCTCTPLALRVGAEA